MKEIEITEKDFDINADLPEEHIPQWYQRNIAPVRVDFVNGRMQMGDDMQRQRQVTKPRQEEDVPKIKPAARMEDPKDSMWYEADEFADPNKVIDNNETVDLEAIQKFNVKVKPIVEEKKEKMDTISKLRAKFDEEKKPKEQARIAAPGEFVVMLNNKVVTIGDANAIKPIVKEIVLSKSNISDNDLVVFLRVPLDTLFE